MQNILHPSSSILYFPRKRGRPKQTRTLKDTGTPELVMKRLRGETVEALDLCLERGIIKPEQHWCGIHLRWLYTLRFGAPGVRAVDPTHIGGVEVRPDDPAWRESREQEYQDAICALAESGYMTAIINLCIYNQRPKFLDLHSAIDENAAKTLQKTLDGIREGLDILSKHWSRNA